MTMPFAFCLCCYMVVILTYVYEQETLLEFRAGKMVFEGRRVTPDTRKGLVRIARV